MSLSLIPYQPLPFGVEENCTLPCADWIQKIQTSDRTSIQFQYGACGTAGSILANGNFASGSTGWTVNGTWTFDAFIAYSPVGSAGYIEQTVAIGADGYYELTFNCNVYNGSLVISTTSGLLVDYVTSSGIYTFTFYLEVGDKINFYFNNAIGGNISNIELKPINTRVRLDVLGLDVLGLDDTYIDTIPDTWFTFNQGYLTANFDWDTLALDDGCYKLAIYDPCECSQFGFAGDDFKVANQFVTDSGNAVYDFINGIIYSVQASPPAETIVRSRGILCRNTSYEFTYTVTGLDGANGDKFELRIGLTTGIARTVDGTYTETLSTAFAFFIDVKFIFTHGTGGSTDVALSDFSFEAVEPVVSYESVPFSLKETHECSVLISACGVGEEFGFNFNATGFKPVIRLEGTYRQSGYPSTEYSYEYSNGNKQTPYNRVRKAWTFLFGAPSYVFDFSALWHGLSNLYINEAAKYCEDVETPTLSLEDDIDFSTATFTFSDRVELTEKRSCGSLPNEGCSTQGFQIEILKTGGNEFMRGRPISANGYIFNFG